MRVNPRDEIARILLVCKSKNRAATILTVLPLYQAEVGAERPNFCASMP